MEGHGSHWECIYENLDTFASERLGELIQTTPVWRSVKLETPTLFEGVPMDQLYAFAENEGDVRFMGLVFHSSATGQNLFASAYPFAAGGIVHSVTIDEIEPWEFGIEATIHGSTRFDADISFFDPLYFLNKDQYRLGEEHNISFAAFAYTASKPVHEQIEITEGGLYEVALQDGNVKEGEALMIDCSKMAAMFPRDDVGGSVYEFQGEVLEHHHTSVDNRLLNVLKATVMRDTEQDDTPFNVPVYAAPHVLDEGFIPSHCTSMSGFFWLQGFLIDKAA